jgi:5-formyltetrahydrofolate cyclo-ligase
MGEDRQDLRKRILAARDAMGEAERQQKSAAVNSNFRSLRTEKQWNTLFVYVNFRSEVETTELISECLAAGVRVAVPLVDAAEKRMIPVLINDLEKDLAPGYYNIPEPDLGRSSGIDPAEIDAALIPGSVFDGAGGRLGYGGGYYDRFLVNDAPQARRIGLAFEMQLVEKVPLEPHDQPLDILITEKRIITVTP